MILMSRFLYNPDISTMPGQFVVQILYNAMLVRLHRIQAGDKLRLRFVNSSPNNDNSYKRLARYHCAAPQHYQNVRNCKGSPNE